MNGLFITNVFIYITYTILEVSWMFNSIKVRNVKVCILCTSPFIFIKKKIFLKIVKFPSIPFLFCFSLALCIVWLLNDINHLVGYFMLWFFRGDFLACFPGLPIILRTTTVAEHYGKARETGYMISFLQINDFHIRYAHKRMNGR